MCVEETFGGAHYQLATYLRIVIYSQVDSSCRHFTLWSTRVVSSINLSLPFHSSEREREMAWSIFWERKFKTECGRLGNFPASLTSSIKLMSSNETRVPMDTPWHAESSKRPPTIFWIFSAGNNNNINTGQRNAENYKALSPNNYCMSEEQL